jgi:hypothetical protein
MAYCLQMIPYPKTYAPWELEPEPEAVCICAAHNAAETAEFCGVCKCDTDNCFECMPDPPCECRQISVDTFDAADCDLHSPSSWYNELARKHAAKLRPVTRKEVTNLFGDILAAMKKPAVTTCWDCRKSVNECGCDPFAVRKSA